MFFRKVNSILLALYLLVSTSGLAFNVHYCEGKIASVTSVFSLSEPCEEPVETNEKSCCKSETASHKDCCSDETLKADTGDIVIKQLLVDFQLVAVLCNQLAVNLYFPFLQNKLQKIAYSCDSNAPPLYLLYSQYIYYA